MHVPDAHVRIDWRKDVRQHECSSHPEKRKSKALATKPIFYSPWSRSKLNPLWFGLRHSGGQAQALRYSPSYFQMARFLIRASLSGYRELPWNGDDPGKSGP